MRIPFNRYPFSRLNSYENLLKIEMNASESRYSVHRKNDFDVTMRPLSQSVPYLWFVASMPHFKLSELATFCVRCSIVRILLAVLTSDQNLSNF